MKLHFTRDWLRRKTKELEEAGIEEPSVIGPPMDMTVVWRTYLENKITDLEGKIEEELAKINERNPDTEFPNMGNTDTLKWQAQIEILKEVIEFDEALTRASKL